MKPRPQQHELNAAALLLEYFKKDIVFLLRTNRPTADFLIDGIIWELKSPTGVGKNNIQRQLQDAHHQSVNVVLDSSRSKMHSVRLKSQATFQFRRMPTLNRLLFISKAGKVIEIYR